MNNDQKDIITKKENLFIAEFTDLKTKLDLYLISLPFIALGMAISSFKINHDMACQIIVIELFSWIAFLISGSIGLYGKHTYLNSILLNIKSIRVKSSLDEIHEDLHQKILESNKWIYEIPKEIGNKLSHSYKSEIILKTLLALGFTLLITSRILIAFSA